MEDVKHSQLLVVIDFQLLLAPGGRVRDVELHTKTGEKPYESETRQPQIQAQLAHIPTREPMEGRARSRRQVTFIVASGKHL